MSRMTCSSQKRSAGLLNTLIPSSIPVSIIMCLLFLMQLPSWANAVGGIAEMKALTGDAPYVGPGNQEQAPEFFGEAAVRQSYVNPVYDPYGSRYMRNYQNTYYNGGGYRSPWRAYGNNGFFDPMPPLIGIGPGVGVGGGGFYRGSGNPWT